MIRSEIELGCSAQETVVFNFTKDGVTVTIYLPIGDNAKLSARLTWDEYGELLGTLNDSWKMLKHVNGKYNERY
jgi:hypothetical protein